MGPVLTDPSTRPQRRRKPSTTCARSAPNFPPITLTAMSRVFSDFPPTSTFFQPSQTATVAANDSETVTLSGRGDRPLAFSRIFVEPDGDPTDILLTAEPSAGGFTFFEDIQSGAVQDLFRHRQLQAPLVLEESRSLEVEIENVDPNNSREVTVELEALPQPILERRLSAVREEYGARLVPVFLYVTGTVGAGATDRQDLLSYRTETELLRFITEVDSSVQSDTKFDIRLPRETPIRDKRKQTVLDQFSSGELPVPLEINVRKEAKLVVDNTSGSQEARYTFLGECYSLPGGPLIE